MAASVWKGHLTFGLVTFPVRLFSAARSETISFNLLHKDDHSRIRQVIYCQNEDKPIQRSEIVKGYEYEKDHYVVIEDEDIKKVAPKTAKVMEILEFVKADQVDPIYLESSYYVAPDEGGEKAYALLFTALQGLRLLRRRQGRDAQSRAHRRPAPRRQGHAARTPCTTRTRSARWTSSAPIPSLVKDKELAMAKMLISSLEADFEPQKYHDEYRDNLQKMIEAKIEGQKVVEIPTEHVAPVIDIMEALKKSLAEKRKPAATARSRCSRARRSEPPKAAAEQVGGSPRPAKASEAEGVGLDEVCANLRPRLSQFDPHSRFR